MLLLPSGHCSLVLSCCCHSRRPNANMTHMICATVNDAAHVAKAIVNFALQDFCLPQSREGDEQFAYG